MLSASFPFAFFAGFITVTSPCVLPILPIILGSALKKNRLYPVFMVLGLAFTFSLLGVLFGSIGSVIGLGKHTLETIAIALLGFMGLVIVVKPLQLAFARFAAKTLECCRLAPRQTGSESALQAFAVGSSLGVVWAPCAGPVLASILALAASTQSAVASFFLLLVYALGAGAPMLAIAYGGQRALSGRRFLQEHTEGIKQAFGWILILTAALLALGLFQKLEAALLPYLPSYITNF